MENILIKLRMIILLSALCVASQAQNNNWKTIDVPVKRKHILMHFSTDSIMISRLSDAQKIYFGKGFDVNNRAIFNDKYPKSIVENSKYIFLAYQNSFVRLEKSNNRIDEFKLADNVFLSKVVINEDYIFAMISNKLTKLNFNCEIIKQLSTSCVNLLVSKSKVYVHLANRRFETYNMDLVLLNSTVGIYSKNLELKNNYITILDQYSKDEGNSWLKFPTQFSLSNTKMVPSYSNTIGRLTNDSLIYSRDYGANFNLVKLPFKPDFVFISNTDDVFIQQETFGGGSGVFTTNLGNIDWREINTNTNQISTSYEIASGINENLVYVHYQGYLGYKLDSLNPIAEVPGFLSFFSGNNNIMHINDEAFFCKNQDHVFLSKDKGQKWEKIFNVPLFFNTYITQKNKSSFVLTQDSVIYSNNNFENHSTYMIHDEIRKIYLDINFRITSELNLFTSSYDIDGQTNEKFLHHHNLITNEYNKYSLANFDSLIVNEQLETSFTGNTLLMYAYKRLSQNEYLPFLIISDDNFKTHIVKKLPILGDIKTDHLNNYFLFRNDDLWISLDKGDTWIDLGQKLPSGTIIIDVQTSQDNFLYLATNKGILKYINALNEPNTIEISFFNDINSSCEKDGNEVFDRSDVKVKINGSDFLIPDSEGLIRYETTTRENKIVYYYDTLDLALCTKDSINLEFSPLPESKQLNIGYTIKTKCPELTASVEKMEFKNCAYNSITFKLCNTGDAIAYDVNFEANLPWIVSHVTGVTDSNHFTDNFINIKLPTLERDSCKRFEYSFDISCNIPLDEYCVTGKMFGSNDCISEFMLNYCINNYSWENSVEQTIFLNKKDITNQDIVQISNNKAQEIEIIKTFKYQGSDTIYHIVFEEEFNSNFNLNDLIVEECSLPFTQTNIGNIMKIEMDASVKTGQENFIKYGIKTRENLMTADELVYSTVYAFDKDFPKSELFVFKIENQSATSEFLKENFDLFPNPFTQTLSIISKNTSLSTIKIFSIHGVLLYNTIVESNEANLNLENISPQLLYVEIETQDHATYRKRILKM